MTEQIQAKLRFLCFGVGAIGTYIGGSLALSGQDVVFVERPQVAENIRRRGMRLGLLGGEKIIPEPTIVSSIDEALTRGPFDVAILAIKSYDTLELLKSLAPYVAALPPFLCLQNGVENEAELAQKLGENRVIPGTVTTAVGRIDAGDVVVERLRGLGLAATHALSPTLLGIFNQAGLKAKLYEHALGMKWSKMLTNLLANATSAILNLSPAEVFSHPGLYRLEVAQLREALQVMAAQGIPVVDLPGTPVRALSFLVKNLPPQISRPLLARSVGKGRGAKMPSFHIDLYAGYGKSEVGYLNGAVARFGDALGIDTPVNHLLNQILQSMVDGLLPKESYARQPEKLLSLLR